MHLPPRRLSICFLHKVNKRYFETLVHSGVASQKRKAGIYFKKWKRFGGRRHISLLVPSLCLENRSRAWDEGGEKGVRKRKGIRCSYDSPTIGGKFSAAGSSARFKGGNRKGIPDSRYNFFCTVMPYVLHTRHLCTELCSDLGKSLPSGSWGESQEGRMQFLQFAIGLDYRIHVLTLMKHDCPRVLTDATWVNQSVCL